jgi:hypothetical protein
VAEYKIRFCRLDEKAELIRFIRESWSHQHILAAHPELLDWQYRADDRYNFVVAYGVESRAFEGVLGFISPGFFEEGRVMADDNLWLSLWKVEKNEGQPPTLGIEMLAFLRKQIPSRTISAIGINAQVARLYRALGCFVGTMSHFFMPNFDRADYRIAQISDARAMAMQDLRSHHAITKAPTLTEVQGADLAAFVSTLPPGPRNRPAYLTARYLNHPYYHYRFFGILAAGAPSSLLVVRKIHAAGSCCLRIIDYVGLDAVDLNITDAIQTLLRAEKAEYIDLLVGGIKWPSLSDKGFFESTDSNYVPHLFEPFSNARVTVSYAVFGGEDHVVLKGDSDLDRPNQVPLLG